VPYLPTLTTAHTGKQQSVFAELASVVFGGTLGRIGVALIVLDLLVAILGPVVAPYPPFAISVGPPMAGPSTTHWLGTDTLGRDILSRLLNGGRSIVFLPPVLVLMASITGVGFGLWSGYKGGLADWVVMRVVDVLMSTPPLLLIMVFVLALGTSIPALVGVIAAFFSPRIVRVIRGATHAVKTQDYVVAARARGESTAVILWREILPNITGPLLAELAIRLTYAIVLISTLNFLGLGVQPPSPDWGLMVGENRIILSQAPLAALAPALAIASLAIGANLIADQIGAHLARNVSYDPRF
jgi:peptide/nickel transport system permease protein